MTSDPQTEMENRSRQASILCDILWELFRGLEPKLYSITILREVLYGQIIQGPDNVYYNYV